MKTLSPLKYMGGKSLMLDSIFEIIPNHNTFVDVFGGSGHVILSKSLSHINIYNDKNNNLVNLFLCMRDHKEELMTRLESLFYSRNLHDEYSKLYKSDEFVKLSNIERSVIYYYLIISSFNGDPRDAFSTSPITNNASTYYNRFEKIKNVYKNITIECLDFRDCIKKYDTENTLFYLDPPYYMREDNYEVLFTEKDHIDLHDILKSIKGKFILSYYPCEIAEKYRLWGYITSHEQKLHSSTNKIKGVSIELLITNYEQKIIHKKTPLFNF